VKGGKTNDKFSQEDGAVDILVFVSRHLSEGILMFTFLRHY
jgi:hypothetical protein